MSKTVVQEPLFSAAAAAERLPEYLELLAESWPCRSWAPILTVEIVADRLELSRREFRGCVQIWGWPVIPAPPGRQGTSHD